MTIYKDDRPSYPTVITGETAHVAPTTWTVWNRKYLYRCRYWWRRLRLLALLCVTGLAYAQLKSYQSNCTLERTTHGLAVKRLESDLATCAKLRTRPIDPPGPGREKSARYMEGSNPTLIVNASVWTGEPIPGRDPRLGTSYSWITADVLLEHGLIMRVDESLHLQDNLPSDLLVYNALGRPLTSGIIDMHSHAGVHSLPTLHGNEDVSELSSDITPYVRSIDGIQPSDPQIQLIKSGGVTTSLILPGSSNNIGGEAFAVKHAITQEDGRNFTSISDMLVDRDQTWRYMKMGCGENAKHVHGRVGKQGPTSRLGESWEMRRAFEHASSLIREQDDWCKTAELGFDKVKTYIPYDLEWESLVAVLRGQVQVHAHCYTVPDLEALVDHSNEFNFSIRAFHHAHQAYLAPEILRRTWGNDTPAAALFADNMWYKAEAAIGSEFAGKVLYDSGLVPIYVSDNPILNAQHVVFEAAKGHKYGLPYHAALAAVTNAPAELLGLGERLGKVKSGFDADIVVWDSDPLSIGAAPVQLWIDGTAQFFDPVELKKPIHEKLLAQNNHLKAPREPVYLANDVIFTGISEVLCDIDILGEESGSSNIVISGGNITCIGSCHDEITLASSVPTTDVFHLGDGYLTPAYTAFGSTLGLNAIESEKVTDNGADGDVFSRAIDGLALGTEKLRVSYRYGVTRAISSPKFTHENTHQGTSVGFQTGFTNPLEDGAVFNNDVSVHYTLDLSAKKSADTPLLSSAVGQLRNKLLDTVAMLPREGNPAHERPVTEMEFLQKVVVGELPLAITVHSADSIAALLRIKQEIEEYGVDTNKQIKLRLLIVGGAESHLLADCLAAAGVAVVLAPFQSYGISWDQRRGLPGAPLTNGTSVDALLSAGVVTAIGLEEDWIVRDLGLLAGIAHANSGGSINQRSAIDLISRNVYTMLGLPEPDRHHHFVIHEGNPLEVNSRVIAVGGGSGKLLLL